jgi:hypothetical protein
MATPEGRVKDKIKRVLKSHGFWYYMPMQNGMGVVGVPDFVCCVRGLFVGIEAKAPGRVATKDQGLSPNQQARRDEILEACGEYWVIDDVEVLKKRLSRKGQAGILRRVVKAWRDWMLSDA